MGSNKHEHNTKAGIMKSVFKVGAIIIGVLVLLGAIGAAVALSLGYLHIGVKQNTEVLVTRSLVCEGPTVDAYNTLVVTFPSNEEDQKEKSDKVQQQVSSIKEKAGYDQDPTCLFIVYKAALDAEDAEEAQRAVTSIKELADTGVFPSIELYDITSIDSMESRVEALKNPVPVGSDPMGSG